MSIKDLFNKQRTLLPQTTNKELTENIESTKNLQEKLVLKNTFVPQIDYSEPANFAKYGSAQLYYNSAIERIYDFFPYDGSDAEINAFVNESLPHERYIFDNLYPKTNGYANFNGSSHISFKGGPHATSYSTLSNLFRAPDSSKRSQANLYETNVYQDDNKPSDYGGGSRESNLKCNFQQGVTVEFWLNAPSPSANSKQTIFHLTNSSGGDELTIFLSGTTGSPFHVSLTGSSTGIFRHEQIGSSPTTSSLSSWNHYAISFKSASSGVQTKLYVNGRLDSTDTLGTTGVNTLKQKGTIGFIASGSAGFLSASMDEFRFWKTERDAFQIGTNYFTQVRGGSNTDISNTTLGVYYKFNEGTTGDSSIDEIVLDYAGRITNGTWSGTPSRTAESAIVEAGAAPTEYKDPIIYSSHPLVSSLKSDLEEKGKFYDHNNTTKFTSYLPSWIIEESESNEQSQLEMVSHIIGAYFDKLYLQIQSVSDFKQPLYTSSSYKPLTFAKHLPQSLGLHTPEIFIDANIINTIANKTEKFNFQNDLEDTKNLIYLNLYNNLASIFKSKGTEKSIKSILRCFYIDDQIIKLNTYSNKARYELRNNLEQTTKLNNYINFNNTNNVNAVVYQKQNPSDTTNTIGYISGSESEGYEFAYGATVQADITFPYFRNSVDIIDRRFNEVSLFGVVSASVQNPDDTSFMSTDNTNFQIFAVRESQKSKNAYFKLKSSLSPNPFTEMTSSVFFGVYNNQDWNFSVSVVPNKSGSIKFVTGSDDYSYTLKFEGYNTLLGDVRDTFSLEQSLTKTQGENFLKSAKRVYAGAYRQNLTGSLINESDVLLSGVRYWLKGLDYGAKKQHSLDFDNIGISDTYENISALDPETKDLDVLNKDMLALSWEFTNLTGSDSSGRFYVTDYSSGSAQTRDSLGWVGNVSGYRHSGYGFGFATSSTSVIENRNINVFKFVDPERTISSDMVTLVNDSQELYGIPEDVVSYHHTLEKSMYSAISDEMLKFFAGAVDFNNLIGEPVNRYRMNYKALEKLREAFFRRVENIKEVEKYIEYYKWFDDSLGDIIRQMIPMSAVVSENVFDVVESHVLERNKYQSKFPTMEFKTSDPESPILGIREKTLDWERAHHPASNSQKDNSEYWKKRANRLNSDVISSGDDTIDEQRDNIIETADKFNNQPAPTVNQTNNQTYSGQTFVLRKLSRPYKLNIDRKNNPPRIIKGGVNFEVNKKFGFHRIALHPAGPINTEDDIFVPRNVLLASVEDLAKVEETNDLPKNPNEKIKRNIKVQSGRDYEDGVGYKNIKSDIAFPFNIISSSVKTGYNKQVDELVSSSFQIVNVHNDVYGDDMEKPMQGPFTEHAVGGLQYRHIAINKGDDSYLTRPEGWKILLGQDCDVLTGAIGMVGPDYPYPEANDLGVSPYPMTGAQKAFLYRDMVAKRPVNIKNIHHRTGSTILGNYNHIYDVVNSVGAFSNPRKFVESQPTLPQNTFTDRSKFATSVRTILDINRGQLGHTNFIGDYSTEYLEAATGDSIIISRFRAPGGIEVISRGYQDFRSSEYSVYNALNARNLTVRRPFQGVSSSIVSETTGIRNFDIHGKDFGLMNHSTRHASRFYRDSTLESNPGTSYDENPSFHRIHRNNITKPREITSTIQIPTALNLTNENALYMLNAGPTDGVCAAAKSADQVRAYLTGSRASGSTFSAWIRVDPDRNAHELFSVGLGDGSVPFVKIEKLYRGGSAPIGHALQLEIRVLSGSSKNTNRFVAVENDLDDGNIHHIAVCYDSTISGSGVDFYVDGVKKTTVETKYVSSTFITKLANSYTFRGLAGTTGDRFYTLGNDTGTNGTSNRLSGSMDQVSIWTTKLTEAEVQSLYNGGNPYNITASTVYSDNSSALHAWWTFEASNGDIINASNPKSHSDSNQYRDSSGNGYDLFAIASSGDIDQSLTAGIPSPVAGDSSTVSSTVLSYVFEDKFDNFNLSHQIPRSDRQYSWITASIVNTNPADPRYAGFMKSGKTKAPPESPYYEVSKSLVPFFDYVTASEAVSEIYQNTTRLNLLVTDETGSSINTLGSSAVGASSLATLPESKRLNALLIRRGDLYGWNWTATRQQDHPILKIEKKQNKITTHNPQTLKTKSFKMSPINQSGRPVYINIYKTVALTEDCKTYTPRMSMTLKSTYNNLKQGFSSRLLEAQTLNSSDTPFSQRKTNFEDMIDMFKQDSTTNLNWVLYSENIFPSQINSFDDEKTFRDDYDNLYWRDLQDDRELVGNTLNNSFELQVSQSSWPLDPPPDFLTRTTGSMPLVPLSLKGKGGGELQNSYFSYHNQAPTPGDNNATEFANKSSSLAPSALYARKHLLPTAKSVVSPSGISIPQTGSGQADDDYGTLPIDMYGGEAVWEAAARAGFVTYEGASPSFINHASEPWFNNYADYKSELKLLSRDHGIVPEFRISEKVEDYLKGGTNGVGLTDTFEIVGTTHNSRDTNFYKDFSNSEFLKEFANISEISDTTPKEIRLVCKAVTRFNPYKGFYPAQRTIDMVNQFGKSYENSVTVTTNPSPSALVSASATTGRQAIEKSGSLLRPLLQPLFAPGILYNTIKSGISVNFPIITTPKVGNAVWNPDPTFGGFDVQRAGMFMLHGSKASPSGSPLAGGNIFKTNNRELYAGGEFWDKRVPFEAILDPDRHLTNVQIFDMEPHPSASLNATASLTAPAGDPAFKKMSNNFFAEVANFFLKDSEYTTLKSDIVQGELNFESGSVYGARLKIRRSTKGPRTYERDKDSSGKTANDDGQESAFSTFGARISSSIGLGTGSLQLPQDPKRNPEFKETFTMYSRPTAFGPAVSGRRPDSYVSNKGILDSLCGYNWAFTPPYYHGESWADLIFYPDHTKSYTLEQILAEIKVKYWRVDSGHSGSYLMAANADDDTDTIYSAQNINENSMQLDASINFFGIENIPFEETNRLTGGSTIRNTTVAQRWVIQPKAETPMFNFSDDGVNIMSPTMPTYASESVPRGMWHQFGNIPEDPKKGIFLEIGDIPSNWLQFHRDTWHNDSIYNNQDVANGGNTLYQRMESLTDLFGFKNSSKRLGELKESQTIREAIVAVPYITKTDGNCEDNITQTRMSIQKEFFTIPKERIESSLLTGTLRGDSELVASDSIRDLIENVKKYVLPPEFDFVADKTKEALVMYFFEFEYKFDRDDLAYIWQNIAPRNYKKMEQKIQTDSHLLADNELLQPEDIIDNKNLRWMVFKVKQRSMAKYENKIYRQVGTKEPESSTSGYQVEYNWPYDYLSFVEMVNMDVEVLMDNKGRKDISSIEIQNTKIVDTPGIQSSPSTLAPQVVESRAIQGDTVQTAGQRINTRTIQRNTAPTAGQRIGSTGIQSTTSPSTERTVSTVQLPGDIT